MSFLFAPVEFVKLATLSQTPAPTPLGNSPLMEAVAASPSAAVQSSGAAATAATGKRRLEERCAFDKRLRFSVRQTESAYRYRDIVVKKQDGFTHILLSTKSSENNTLNPEVCPPAFTNTVLYSLAFLVLLW